MPDLVKLQHFPCRTFVLPEYWKDESWRNCDYSDGIPPKQMQGLNPQGYREGEGPRGGVAGENPQGYGEAVGPRGGVAESGPRGNAIAEGPGGDVAVRGPAGNVAVGSRWTALPAGAGSMVISGQRYYVTNGVYYRPYFVGSEVNYVVVQDPLESGDSGITLDDGNSDGSGD